MKTSGILLGGFLSLAVMSACNKNDDDNLNSTDRNFLTNAAYSNNSEVNAGQVAAARGSNPGVRTFGQMMVNDHTTAQTELDGVASSVGMDVPDQPDQMHMELVQRLNTLSGQMFDSAYMNSQVMDHQNAIALFEMEVSQGRDSRVINYANKYLPALRMHLQMADSLARAVR